MSLRSRSRRSEGSRGGFSLIEALVSLTVLVVVMTLAMSLLFSMRSFADKQQYFTEPRQTARRAIDYLSHQIAGASDLNVKRNNPLAIVTWYNNTKKGIRQATYNNLTGNPASEPGNSAVGTAGLYTAFGDVGTDIISVAVPTRPLAIPVSFWPGDPHGANLRFDFREGCGANQDNASNMARFQQVTGATGSGDAAASGLLILVDANGDFGFYQITSYQTSTCPVANIPFDPNNPTDVIQVVNNPGPSGETDPPGRLSTLQKPITLAGGVQFLSFRVRTPTDAAGKASGPPNLEQKAGLFDPSTDNPGTAFTPIIENVEDMQIAYLYSAPPGGEGGNLIFNNDPATGIPASVPKPGGGTITTQGVPPQAGSSDPPTPYDIANIAGLRITITGRSNELPLVALNQKVSTGAGATHFRPRAEDHPRGANDQPSGPSGATGLYEHHRLTTTLMLRNRMLGN